MWSASVLTIVTQVTPEAIGSDMYPILPLFIQGINLEEFSTVEELVSLGGDALKCALQSMGLKCGGTAMERARRLLSTKGKSIDELDRSLYAKNRKWKTMKPLT